MMLLTPSPHHKMIRMFCKSLSLATALNSCRKSFHITGHVQQTCTDVGLLVSQHLGTGDGANIKQQRAQQWDSEWRQDEMQWVTPLAGISFSIRLHNISAPVPCRKPVLTVCHTKTETCIFIICVMYIIKKTYKWHTKQKPFNIQRARAQSIIPSTTH